MEEKRRKEKLTGKRPEYPPIPDAGCQHRPPFLALEKGIKRMLVDAVFKLILLHLLYFKGKKKKWFFGVIVEYWPGK
jgi:hypothetical protein